MKTFFIFAVLFSSLTWAAPERPTVTRQDPNSSTSSATPKKEEPSSFPCPPQKTRDQKLDDLAKLEGQGESHSTNCPAQGVIKDTPAKTSQ